MKVFLELLLLLTIANWAACLEPIDNSEKKRSKRQVFAAIVGAVEVFEFIEGVVTAIGEGGAALEAASAELIASGEETAIVIDGAEGSYTLSAVVSEEETSAVLEEELAAESDLFEVGVENKGLNANILTDLDEAAGIAEDEVEALARELGDWLKEVTEEDINKLVNQLPFDDTSKKFLRYTLKGGKEIIQDQVKIRNFYKTAKSTSYRTVEDFLRKFGQCNIDFEEHATGEITDEHVHRVVDMASHCIKPELRKINAKLSGALGRNKRSETFTHERQVRSAAGDALVSRVNSMFPEIFMITEMAAKLRDLVKSLWADIGQKSIVENVLNAHQITCQFKLSTQEIKDSFFQKYATKLNNFKNNLRHCAQNLCKIAEMFVFTSAKQCAASAASAILNS